MAAAIVLNRKEERLLIKRIKHGERVGASDKDKREAEEAKLILFRMNQFLVGAIASRYPNVKKSFLVLMAAGNRGLETALEHYDLEKSYRFSAYATWWIRAEIHKELGLPIDQRH